MDSANEHFVDNVALSMNSENEWALVKKWIYIIHG